MSPSCALCGREELTPTLARAAGWTRPLMSRTTGAYPWVCGVCAGAIRAGTDLSGRLEQEPDPVRPAPALPASAQAAAPAPPPSAAPDPSVHLAWRAKLCSPDAPDRRLHAPELVRGGLWRCMRCGSEGFVLTHRYEGQEHEAALEFLDAMNRGDGFVHEYKGGEEERDRVRRLYLAKHGG